MAQVAGVEVAEHGLERLEVVAAADVGDDGRPLDLGAVVDEQLDERADHPRREVVDAEVAAVLEDVHRRRLAGAGEARDHDEVLSRLEDGLARRRRSSSGRRGLTTAMVRHCGANRGRAVP